MKSKTLFSEVRKLSSNEYKDLYHIPTETNTTILSFRRKPLFKWDSLTNHSISSNEEVIHRSTNRTKKGHRRKFKKATKLKNQAPHKVGPNGINLRNQTNIFQEYSPVNKTIIKKKRLKKQKENKKSNKKKRRQQNMKKLKKNKRIQEIDSKQYLTNNDTMLIVNDQHFGENYLSLNDVNSMSEVPKRLSTTVNVFTSTDNYKFEKDFMDNTSLINNSNKINNELYNLHLPKFRTKWRAYAQRNFTSDENECLINNGGCEGLCINIPGSYRCHCPKGFRLDVTRRLCLDINECAARNGHGPCQGDCINTWGSYRCDCSSLTGTQLAHDKHSCKLIDACLINNCSHICINTRIGAHCSCPQGYQLNDDWRTCQDIDECQLMELQQPKCIDQHKECLNTIGSYNCV